MDENALLLELRTMLTIPRNLKSVVDRDGAIILDTPNNLMTPLNSTGAYVWRGLERGMMLDDIVAQLARETNTDIAIVAVDVDRFMEQLKSRHLLVTL